MFYMLVHKVVGHEGQCTDAKILRGTSAVIMVHRSAQQMSHGKVMNLLGTLDARCFDFPLPDSPEKENALTAVVFIHPDSGDS